MPTGFDHIVIAVNDLAETVADYTAAGFTVTPGGEHTGGRSHNALVTFQDGAYFELIAFKGDQGSASNNWLALLKSGEGLVDFALRTDDLDREVDWLRTAGLDVAALHDGGRTRPDGARLEWRTLRFGPNRTGALPFYCHDFTDRSLRVPGGDAARHANGVTGVRGISLVVNDLAAASLDFVALTGAAGEASSPGIEDAGAARRFGFGTGWIELIEPAAGDNPLRRHLTAKGERPYEVTLVSPGGDGSLLPLDQTHGARLRLVS